MKYKLKLSQNQLETVRRCKNADIIVFLDSKKVWIRDPKFDINDSQFISWSMFTILEFMNMIVYKRKISADQELYKLNINMLQKVERR